MYYIEKADKPNAFEKIFSIVKLKENKILLPNIDEKKSTRLAKKTNKILQIAQSNKIVLSKEVQLNKSYVNYLNSYGYYIVDGKILFEILINCILNYITNKNKILKEETQVSLLVNNVTDYLLENIIILANEYKSINIVTNHMEKFNKIEEKIYNDQGLILTVSNNKKKSLAKSKLIVNIDFTNELINKYNIFDESIIVDIRGDTRINKKRFNGIIINDYEIKWKGLENEDKFFSKELYESKLYPNMKYKEIINKIINDKVEIKALFGWNGEIL